MVEQPKPALVEQWAVEVWRKAVDATGTFIRFKTKPDQAAASVIETAFAEREVAKDAEIARLKHLAEEAADCPEGFKPLGLLPVPAKGALADLRAQVAELVGAERENERLREERATDFRTAVAYDCGYQAALDMVERQLSAVQYDPAPYTAMMARLRAMRVRLPLTPPTK